MRYIKQRCINCLWQTTSLRYSRHALLKCSHLFQQLWIKQNQGHRDFNLLSIAQECKNVNGIDKALSPRIPVSWLDMLESLRIAKHWILAVMPTQVWVSVKNKHLL